MKSISIEEFNQDVEKYLNLAYLERDDVIIRCKGHTYKIQSLSPPCRFTLDELKERLQRSEDDIKAGRYYTEEDVRLLLKINIFEIAKEKLFERIDSTKLIDKLNIFINELEASHQKPKSLFEDRDKFEAVLQKVRSFKRK